jgi:hypothetical protein
MAARSISPPLGKKVSNQLNKARRVFHLNPMAASTKDVQLGGFDHLVQPNRILQWDDFVVSAVNDQSFVTNTTDIGIG